jgi:hypothetical protein
MPDGPAEDARVARARLRWKRAALTLVSVLALVLVVPSTWQIVTAVFGARIRPIPAAAEGSPARTCAEGIAHLERDDSWDGGPAAQQACAQSPEGLDAWAALLRLRTAQVQLAGAPEGPRELAVLRRDVASHLPPDLR